MVAEKNPDERTNGQASKQYRPGSGDCECPNLENLCEWYFWIALGLIVPKCDGIWGFGGGCGCGDVIKMAVTISFLL